MEEARQDKSDLIEELTKLFRINIPIQEHFEYYIDTLEKSEEFDWVRQTVVDFEKYQEDVVSMGYKSAKSYKLDYALPKMKDYIINSDAYGGMKLSSLSIDTLRSKDNLRNNDNEILMSIDFNSANFSAIKLFDDDNELGDNWEELCQKLEIHPTLAKSKSFRQYVFGNTAPKNLTRIQHFNIIKIVDELTKVDGDMWIEEEDIVFISHDEIIIKLSPDKSFAPRQYFTIKKMVENILLEKNIGMNVHYKVFQNFGIGKSACVQTVYNVKLTGLSEKFKTLFKVPSSKFFKFFKTYVLEEALDRRDLMFMNDGEIAIWSEIEDLVVETIAPPGEMTYSQIEKEYPYLVAEIKDNVSSLSNAQIRKIVNIFIGCCDSCHNAPSGCFCWRDE